MMVLSEDSPRMTPSASARSLKAVTEAAKIVGCPVHYIPQEELGVSAAEALAYFPPQSKETPGVWLGYIPSPDWYAAIYSAALDRGIRLLNTPEEHLNAQEFDRTYAFLRELTPPSVILTDLSQCEQAIQKLGLPETPILRRQPDAAAPSMAHDCTNRAARPIGGKTFFLNRAAVRPIPGGICRARAQ